MGANHPLIESVLLPLAVALLVAGIARVLVGPRRGGLAAGVAVTAAILAAMAWRAGWPASPVSLLQKLPWIFLAAGLTGLAVAGMQRRRGAAWGLAVVAWLAMLAWLGPAVGPSAGTTADLQTQVQALILPGVFGAVLLAAGLRCRPDRADTAAILVVASLGLAALTLTAGSLALFQTALLIAAAAGGVALWQWPVSRIEFGPAATVVVTLSWLAVAHSARLLTGTAAASIGLLGLGVVIAAVAATTIGRSRRRIEGPRLKAAAVPSAAPPSPTIAPIVAALIVGALAAAAIGWQMAGPNASASATTAPGGGGGKTDDAYLD